MVEPKPTSGRKSRGLFVVFLILLLAGGGWGAWHWHEAQTAQRAAAARPAAPAPVPVQAASVEESDIPIYMTGLGSVQALNTVTVRSRVDGQIDKIAFQEGQMVKEGDLLLQIDPRPFQAALDQAVAKKAQDEAQLVSAKADLERTRQLITR